MQDYYELDMLSMIDDEGNEKNSGDAICCKVHKDGIDQIYVIDCGYKGTHEKVINHIRKYYKNPGHIDKLILTHPDQDHASGMAELIENIEVKELWMLIPWNYTSEIMSNVSDIHTEKSIEKILKKRYVYVKDIEAAAKSKGVNIYSPFQGERIGDFTVLHPSKKEYIDLIINSKREPLLKEQPLIEKVAAALESLTESVTTLTNACWGKENLPGGKTTNENEMSVVQFAEILGQKILLTGDVGVRGLREATNYAKESISLPGIDKFQAPHHGARRNLSSELLDEWLGEKKDRSEAISTNSNAIAMISASKNDEKHPRKEVIRALIHRGACVLTTQDADFRVGKNAPPRQGWSAATGETYPEESEK